MLTRFLLVALLVGFAGSFAPALGQQKAPARKAAGASRPAATAQPVGFFTTYTYTSYTIFDQGSGQEPMLADGVGGTLTLRPDGSYAKRLQLGTPSGPMTFAQDGRFTFSGDQISFSYTDGKGQPRTDQGSFRLDPKKRLLVLTIQGYPAGNKGVYTLMAQPQAATAPAKR